MSNIKYKKNVPPNRAHVIIQQTKSKMTTSITFDEFDPGTKYDSLVNKDLDSYDTNESSFQSLGDSIINVLEVEDEADLKMPATISVTLTESEVFYLLDMPSITAEKGTEDGNRVEKDNTRYAYLTSSKGRNRKMISTEAQTFNNMLKTRTTHAERQHNTNQYAFATNWDMYDTYKKLAKNKNADKVKLKCTKNEEVNIDDDEVESSEISILDEQMKNLLSNENFQKSLMVMERVLANNNFHEQQKRFRGLTQQDPFRSDIKFNYRLDLLWTFKNNRTFKHPVTCMQWNPSNSDILAVGYGKFYFTDEKDGLVYCWNIKNPTQPEREYRFDKPVSSLAFSNFEPNLLAVGLYNGIVKVLDISKKNVVVLFESSTLSFPSYEPVWNIVWFPPDDFNKNEEQMLCAGQDGRITYYKITKNRELVAIPMMKITETVGDIKGIYHDKPCQSDDVPILISPAAHVITPHPHDKNDYFICSDEGTVHKCSRNVLHQHLDVFMAHEGPVYSMEFSPFCDKLFLTCGADWYVRIWAENITEPLISLCDSTDPVEGAAWSPAISTVLANISGNNIYLWDLQRKVYLPASIHKSPTNSRNTVIQFTSSGRNLIVGDVDGNVHVYSLEDMPFSPFYQESMLEKVIYKCLVTKPGLIKEIKKLDGLSWKTHSLEKVS